MELITVHKIINYTDHYYYVEYEGKQYEPSCNCEQYYALKEVDPERTVDRINFSYSITKNDLVISITKNDNNISFTKFICEQPYTNRPNSKVIHEIKLSANEVTYGAYDYIFRYGSIHIYFAKGLHIKDEMKFCDQIILPDNIGQDDIWIYKSSGSSGKFNPDTNKVEYVTDLSCGQKVDIPFVSELFDIYTQFKNNILDYVNNLDESISAKSAMGYVSDLMLNNMHLIEKIKTYLDANILEICDDSDAFIKKLNKLHRGTYINSGDKFCKDRKKLIENNYAIYRGGKDLGVVNITKNNIYNNVNVSKTFDSRDLNDVATPGFVQIFHLDNSKPSIGSVEYHTYVQNKRYTFDDIAQVKQFLEELDKSVSQSGERSFEVISVEIYTEKYTEYPLCDDELSLISF